VESDQASAAEQHATPTLNRVQKLLAEDWKHPFTTEPCRSTSQRAASEAVSAVVLPQEYRGATAACRDRGELAKRVRDTAQAAIRQGLDSASRFATYAA
jgi:hypothetical protein